MNITPTQRSITEYHMTLSEEDAREAIDSPWTLGEKIAEKLRSAGVTPNGNGKAHPKPQAASQLTIGRKRKKGAPKAGAGQSAKRSKSLQCPQCEMTFVKQGYLNRHLLKVHQVEPAAAASGA